MTARTVRAGVALGVLALVVAGAPAAAAEGHGHGGHGNGGHGNGHGHGHGHGSRDLGRQVLGPTDGWAAAEGGTTGGSAATEEYVFHVDTWQELRDALGGADARTNQTPRIVYVHGELNAYEQADGTLATCDTFEATSGFDQDAYVDAFDADTWQWRIPEAEVEALQAAQDAAAEVQAAQTQQHIGSRTTVVGVGDDARIVGANLRIRDADDVIVRNLTVSDSTDCFPEWDPGDGATGNWNSRYDNISVWTSTHVWVDHTTLDSGAVPPSALDTVHGRPYEVHDGLLDITHSSDLVTVSYNVFGEHDKTMLIGSSDSRTADRGTLRVTVHHNHFVDIGQRAPRVRYGQVHVYNNLYTQTTAQGFTYFWGVGRESQLYVENNYLDLAPGADPATVVGAYGGTAMTEVGTRIDHRRVSALALYNAAHPDAPLGGDAGWEPVLHDRVQPTSAVRAHVRHKAGAGVIG
ncbi:pectate lyase [Actinotalea ferrariae]|uniref:pectate lyase family protein n=1 Tax=Actinotalea ferrariae TaxID=1386098 RepID=UPI001C8C0ADE|nr:pectate lyase [Actinotalea ferrariae]MBX9243285.1 pectate lyase [Actinotalea ferrariae]